jgi:hypothetical protein
VAPKILPIRLLMSDPLLFCVGGGGTTVLEGSGMLPLATRCTSFEMSAEGGGAMTEGAGKLNLGCIAARSGAEAGGGTTPAFIGAGEREVSRLTALGAAGITLGARVGTERVASRVTLGAGSTTVAVREGTTGVLSRETRGAGDMTAGPSAGATRA